MATTCGFKSHLPHPFFKRMCLQNKMRKWRNWQTRRLQVPVVAIPCGFKSRLPHSFFICNCSEPSRFSCKSVNHACMNEHFYMEIYSADTPHRRNAQHFGGGSEQLRLSYHKLSFLRCNRFVKRKGVTEVTPIILCIICSAVP